MTGLVILAAAAATTFNLVCTGTITQNSLATGQSSEPYSYTYRIDLATKQWCEADCKTLNQIYKVDPGFLTLEPPKDVDTVSTHELFRDEINRETGRHYMISQTGRGGDLMLMKWEGSCQKAAFTGFPKLSTKF